MRKLMIYSPVWQFIPNATGKRVVRLAVRGKS
jgi:hypothetical protein